MLKLLMFLLVLQCWTVPDWTKVDDYIMESINDRIFPGCSLTVSNQTHIIYRKNYGYLTYANQNQGIAVTNDTKYDLASITKMIAIGFAMMKLVSQNSIQLTDLVSKFYPDYATFEKGNTTIKNLLSHNSGLPFDYPGPLPGTKQELFDFIIFAKPDFPVGTKYQYSNLGYLLLGEIIAIVTNKPFNSYFNDLTELARLSHTNFNPPYSQWYNIAPTEYDGQLRKRIVRGQPHQRLAYFFGEATGHCCVFSTVDDVNLFMRIMLSGGKIPDETERILPEEIINLFTSRVTGVPYVSPYGLGFIAGCPGTKMKNCFGHTGTTGTMAFGDKDTKIAYALLSNHAYPYKANQRIMNFTYTLPDLIMQTLGF